MSIKSLVWCLLYLWQSKVLGLQLCTVANMLLQCADQADDHTITDWDCMECQYRQFRDWYPQTEDTHEVIWAPGADGADCLTPKGIEPHNFNTRVGEHHIRGRDQQTPHPDCPGPEVPGLKCRYTITCNSFTDLKPYLGRTLVDNKDRGTREHFNFAGSADVGRVIYGNTFRRLFHATKREPAAAIEAQRRDDRRYAHGNNIMRLGSNANWYGAGIYFAESPTKAAAKVRQMGNPDAAPMIIECKVWLGRIMNYGDDHGQHKLTFEHLQALAFDSIQGEPEGYTESGEGPEFVVYNMDQVQVERVRATSAEELLHSSVVSAERQHSLEQMTRQLSSLSQSGGLQRLLSSHSPRAMHRLPSTPLSPGGAGAATGTGKGSGDGPHGAMVAYRNQYGRGYDSNDRYSHRYGERHRRARHETRRHEQHGDSQRVAAGQELENKQEETAVSASGGAADGVDEEHWFEKQVMEFTMLMMVVAGFLYCCGCIILGLIGGTALKFFSRGSGRRGRMKRALIAKYGDDEEDEVMDDDAV